MISRKSIYFWWSIGYSMSCTNTLYPMDSAHQEIVGINSVPSEIKHIIMSHTFDRTSFTYNMDTQNLSEILLIPTTMRHLQFAHQIRVQNNTTPSLQEKHFLDTQLWIRPENQRQIPSLIDSNKVHIRFGKESSYTEDQFDCDFPLGIQKAFYFDGINARRKAVFATTGETIYTIFLLHQSPDNSDIICHQKLTCLAQGKGYLHAITLHPEHDQILYTVAKESKKTAETQKQNCSIITLDLDQNRNIDAYETKVKGTLLRKIIPISTSTYIGLTQNGMLALLEQQKNHTISYKIQKHTERFFDIAVDDSVQTAQGFKPHIACITRSGKLFASDMFAFTQPTLFLIQEQIPDHLYASALFYDQGKVAVLYQNSVDQNAAEPVWTNLLVWPDNLSAFLLKKQLGLTQPLHPKTENNI